MVALRNAQLIALSALALMSSSCASRFSPNPKPTASSASFVRATLPTSTGGLAQITPETLNRPRVIIFAQETCTTCLAETQGLLASLPVAGQEPTNVEIITLLMGADEEIAQEWKATLHVPWTVGFDERADALKQYCRIKQTPCTLVEMPGRGIVFEHTGEVHYAELAAITGEWL